MVQSLSQRVRHMLRSRVLPLYGNIYQSWRLWRGTSETQLCATEARWVVPSPRTSRPATIRLPVSHSTQRYKQLGGKSPRPSFSSLTQVKVEQSSSRGKSSLVQHFL